MQFPRMLLVRQNFPDRRVPDLRAAVQAELAGQGFAERVRPGGSVAIGVGSRGIANLAEIVRAVVDYWQAHGMKPFIFPAMGSHGAATAEGQAEVLAQYGVREATMGCPVVSQLEVVSLGCSEDGLEAWLDRKAYEADGVMLVGRVKWHTDFAGAIESGLLKMIAIGLGKFAGARYYHVHAYKLGLERVIRSVGRQALRSGKIIGGLAILEDANHNTGKVAAVPAEGMEEKEEELLALVKEWQGHVPVRELDVLILDEIGKNISGAGMDTKVVNRSVEGLRNHWPGVPVIERIYVRDLSDASYGNAVGIGMADVVHDRLVSKVDWVPTRINSLTANSLAAIRVPVHFPTDRECLEVLAQSVGRFDPREVTFCWIRNTMQLNRVVMSENLREEIRANPILEIVEGPFELKFDAQGNLKELHRPEKGEQKS